jgi:hypothetical protein
VYFCAVNNAKASACGDRPTFQGVESWPWSVGAGFQHAVPGPRRAESRRYKRDPNVPNQCQEIGVAFSFLPLGQAGVKNDATPFFSLWPIGKKGRRKLPTGRPRRNVARRCQRLPQAHVRAVSYGDGAPRQGVAHRLARHLARRLAPDRRLTRAAA